MFPAPSDPWSVHACLYYVVVSGVVFVCVIDIYLCVVVMCVWCGVVLVCGIDIYLCVSVVCVSVVWCEWVCVGGVGVVCGV